MENEINTREAVENDVLAMVELWKEMMDLHKIFDALHTRREDGHEKFAEFIGSNIAKEDWIVLVAEVNGKIIGFIQAKLSEYPPVIRTTKYGEIMDIAVKESYRRKGAGQKLVEEVKSWFKSQNISRVEVRAAVGNEMSKSFYRKTGFRPFLEALFCEI